VRHRYLHVALKPFVLPVEGERKIVGRSMTIRAAEPVQGAFIEGSGARLWSKSETMHISLRIPEEIPPDLNVSQLVEAIETSDQAGRTESTSGRANTETASENSYKALQRQVEDLTAALKELQARIAGQTSELESVKAEVKRLQDHHATGAHERVPTTSPLE
jgi:Tfp pilus assembly protein FimV